MTAQSSTNLRTRANSIRTSVALGAVTPSIVGGLLVDMVDSGLNVPELSTSTGNAAQNTAAINAAIVAANAAYLASDGSAPVVVELPAMEIPLAANTSSAIYWNYGVQVPASGGCIAVLDGVRLICTGATLKPTDPALDCIYIVNGNDQTIEGAEIDGSWTGTGAGHAILQVTATNDPTTAVARLAVRNVYAHDVGSYGLGMENGTFTDCLVENLRTKNTGADGIDIKNRPYPTNDSKGITLRSIYVENHGLRLDGQAGVDIRGYVNASAITVIGVGRTGVQMTGIRFRTAGTDAGWARGATVTGFYVRATSAATANTLGVDIGGADCQLIGGTVDDCQTGVSVGGNGTAAASRNAVTGVNVSGAGTRAFEVLSGAQRNRFIGCGARNSAIGFRNEGDYTARIGFTHDTCTTVYSTSSAALATEQNAADQSSTGDFLVLGSSAVGRCNLIALGTSTNVDIQLEPKGTGVVRFGTFTASADAPVNGYITIRRGDGTVTKLATIA